MKCLQAVGAAIICGLSLVGCFSHEKEMRDDMFKLQTRVLDVESRMQADKTRSFDKQLGANQRLDQLNEELVRLKHELERLQVGVVRGELPGAEKNTSSIGSRLAAVEEKLQTDEASVSLQDLAQRMTELEKAQMEVLTTLDALVSQKNVAKPASSGLKASSIKGAFDKKQYTQITQEWPRLKKDTKGKSREEGDYYYAESLFKLGKTKEAAVSFDDALKSHGKSSFKPKFILRLGDCMRLLGDKEAAISYYQELVDSYPKDDAVQAANRYIKQLRS
jgi:TolA-binding protein